jgi:hypothetical protein
MNVIQEITSQTSVGASQTAESIGNLAQLAANLRRSVADFKLPAERLDEQTPSAPPHRCRAPEGAPQHRVAAEVERMKLCDDGASPR